MLQNHFNLKLLIIPTGFRSLSTKIMIGLISFLLNLEYIITEVKFVYSKFYLNGLLIIVSIILKSEIKLYSF
jgi:hypothetical protein